MSSDSKSDSLPKNNPKCMTNPPLNGVWLARQGKVIQTQLVNDVCPQVASLHVKVEKLEAENKEIKAENKEIKADGEIKDMRIEKLEAQLSHLEYIIEKGVSTGNIKETCSRYKLSVREYIRQVHHYVINKFLAGDGESFLASLSKNKKNSLKRIHRIDYFLTFLEDNCPHDYSRYEGSILFIRESIQFSDAVETLFTNYNDKIANHSAHDDTEPFEVVLSQFNDVLTRAGEIESKKELAMKTLLALENLNEFVNFKSENSPSPTL